MNACIRVLNRAYEPPYGDQSLSALTEPVDATSCAWGWPCRCGGASSGSISPRDPTNMSNVYAGMFCKEDSQKLDLSVHVLVMTHLSSNTEVGEFLCIENYPLSHKILTILNGNLPKR